MKKNIVLLLLSLSSYSSLMGLTFGEQFGNYREQLVQEREIVAEKRSTKEEEIRLDNHLTGEIEKRDIMDKLREKESQIRKEIRKIF